MAYVIAGLFQTLFWFVVLGLALWVCRKLAPSLEVPLFKVNFIRGIGMLIRRGIARARGFRVALPDPSEQARSVTGSVESPSPDSSAPPRN